VAFGITRSEKHAFAVLELGGVLDSGLAETGELPTLTEFWAEKSMKLPAYERAVVPERKIVAYLLSLSHRKEQAMIEELANIVLTADMPAHGLRAGDIGTVVLVHEGGNGYTVEFMTLSGDTVAVVTVSAEQIRPIRTNEIAHVRELAA
jgi:hypothetical protein